MTTEKKDIKPQKRPSMSGLSALRQNLGVTPKDDENNEKPNESVGTSTDIKEDIKPTVANEVENHTIPVVTQNEKIPQDSVDKAQEKEIKVIQSNEPVKESPKEKGTFQGAKPPLEHFFRRAGVEKQKKETINISTNKRNAIKILSVLEESTINDTLENIIDWFFETYNDEIMKKPGMKDIMKTLKK